MGLKCRKCGDNEFFLQQRGIQVGAYCKNCGSWLKWVGKKEIPIYKNRGAKVFPEGMEITLKMQDDIGISALGIENLGVGIESIDESEKYSYRDKIEEDKQEKQQPWEKEIIQEKFIEEEVEKRVQLELNKNKKEAQKENERGEEEEFCPICAGLPIEMEEKSKVDMVLYSDVLTITDLSGVQVLGFWKVKYCPNCGKKLN